MHEETGEQNEQVAVAEPRYLYQDGRAVLGQSRGRRGQIIDATMRLIARDGVATLSTRKIAREAAVNLATLHYLFGSKDDLLLAVLDAATSTMIAALILDASPGSGVRVALAESFVALSALLDRQPATPVIRCEIRLYASGRPAQIAGGLQHRRYLNALEVCYRVACAPGEIGLIASEDLAMVVAACIDGMALQRAMGMPAAMQAAARAHMLRALLALVPPESPCR